MFGLGKKIIWIFLVVFFIALAAIATTFYEADREGKEQIKNTEAIKNGVSVIGTIVDFASSWFSSSDKTPMLESVTLSSTSQMIASNLETVSSKKEEIDKGAGDLSTEFFKESLSSSVNNILGEGQNLISDGKNILSQDSEINWRDGWQKYKFWDYRRTENGAEIILSSKDSQEYIIPLPFKFLSIK